MATATKLSPEKLVSDYYEFKRSKSHPGRSAATRASSIGHPCTAYLLFERTDGEKKDLPDAKLACIFAEGNLQEHGVLSDLREMGYTVIEHQRSVYYDDPQISGHIDGWIQNGDGKVLIDIKSCSPFAFAKLNSEEDMRESSQWYYQKWVAQMQIYMLLESTEECWIILKNKVTGEIKAITIHLDYAYAEDLIRKAEAVKEGIMLKSVSIQEEAWRITWLRDHRLNDIEMCSECPFKSICLPEIDPGEGASMLEDPEFEAMIDRHEEIKPIAKEYDSLHDEIIGEARIVFEQGHTALVCGKYAITGKMGKRKVYNVPPDVKKQYEAYADTWRTSISKIEG